MKQILLVLTYIFCFLGLSLAIRISPFIDTDTYTKRAKDIVIAECLSIPEKHKPIGNGTLNTVDIKIVLKGDKQLGKYKVVTIDSLEVGKNYLLMSMGGFTQGTDFLANGELSVVPVPSFLNTDSLKEKSLNDKLHYIFAGRLYEVQRKLEPLLREKSLLDKALLDRTDNLYVSPKPIHMDKISNTFATDYKIGEGATYLNLDLKQMEWSKGGDKTGYLYPHGPGEKRIVWEFATIDYPTFEALEGKELKVRFSGTDIPPGGSTISIKESQMVLARHIDEPSVIYILRIDQQEVDKVFVRYSIIER